MNEPVKAPTRRKWTLAELDRLSAHGFFGVDEHVELIGGELYEMAPKGVRHENIRGEVADRLSEQLSKVMKLRVELGWRPMASHYLEPDILIGRAQRSMPIIAPSEVLLIIEIAKTSLAHDQGLKAETYASLGVADYWVIDAVSLRTRLHRRPGTHGYGDVADLAATQTLVPLLIPGLALRLADFDFGDDGLDENEP